MHSMYIRTVSFSFGTFDAFLAEIKRIVHVASLDQMSKADNSKRAYCPNIPYARHYKPRLVYFLPHFQRQFL